jgi:hypothetical protein
MILYSLLGKSNKGRWAGHVTHMGEHATYLSENLKIDNLEGSRHRWNVNIEIDLKEIVCDDLKGIRLALDRNHWRAVVDMALNISIPQKATNFLTR